MEDSRVGNGEVSLGGDTQTRTHTRTNTVRDTDKCTQKYVCTYVHTLTPKEEKPSTKRQKQMESSRTEST